MNIQLHGEILKLEKKFAYEETQGCFISNNERLYEYQLLYSEALSQFHYLDSCRKIEKDRQFLEFKKSGQAKTDKVAEAMARVSDAHTQCVEQIRIYEKLKCQLFAKITYINGQIDNEKSSNIAKAVEKKYSIQSGEGQY